MWFHCDTPSFGIQSVGVLTSDRVDGPYTFASPCFQPDGEKSYDMGTFVDERGTGKAYLIRSVRNQFAGISRMTDDCTNVTGISSFGVSSARPLPATKRARKTRREKHPCTQLLLPGP